MAYETILLTHDGSEIADAAVPHAELLATLSGARLIVLQVIDSIADVLIRTGTAAAGAYQTAMTGELAEEAVQAQRADAERTNAAVAERLRGAGVTHVETLVLEGSAGSTIVDAATEQHCDLIVMATHGRGGLGRALLGSVADHVVRNASCPVLLCRPQS